LGSGAGKPVVPATRFVHVPAMGNGPSKDEIEANRKADRAEAERDAARGQLAIYQDVHRQHAEAMANFREQNNGMMAQFQSTIAALSKELDLAKAEPFDPKDPDKYEKIKDSNFDKFCKAAGKYLRDVPKLKKPSVAVLGLAGVGKSTLINAFAGQHVVAIDVVECTDKISQAYSTDEYDFYDVPGQTDERADFYNIDNLHKIKALHMILVVYTNRIQTCTNAAKLMKSIEIPVFFVRQKCDFMADTVTKDRAHAQETKVKNDLGLENFPLFFLGKLAEKGYRMEGIAPLMTAVSDELGKVASSDLKRKAPAEAAGDAKRQLIRDT